MSRQTMEKEKPAQARRKWRELTVPLPLRMAPDTHLKLDGCMWWKSLIRYRVQYPGVRDP